MQTKYLALLASLLLPACISTYGYHSTTDGRLLAEVQTDAGSSISYTIHSDGEDAPTIHRAVTATIELAHLGLRVYSLDGDRAEDLGVEPWRGVLVDRVVRGSAAERAGVERGDVLLSIGSTDLTSREQFIELVETALVPRQTEQLRLARPGADGGPMTVQVEPDSREVDETTTDVITLASPADVRTRTGMQVATVPADLAEEIWSETAPVTIVAGVVTGSPAYHAGLRGGDFILSAGGRAVGDASDVLAAMNRADTRLNIEADGLLGPHSTSIAIENDVYQRSSFHIPIVIDHNSRVDRTSTSFLEFIFQFGYNYRKNYLASETRRTRRSSHLSILPFGMFEFDRSPSGNRTTIFWLISWHSR